jgi:hypothetical protein
MVDQDLRSQRIAIAEDAFGELLVDGGDIEGLVFVVPAYERAPRNQPDLHCLEVSGEHGLVVRLVRPVGVIAVADPAVRPYRILLAAGERQRGRASHGFDSGDRGQPLTELVGERRA